MQNKQLKGPCPLKQTLRSPSSRAAGARVSQHTLCPCARLHGDTCACCFLLLPAALKRSNPQPVSLPWCLVVKQSRTAGRIWGRQKFSCRPFYLQIWAFKCIILIRIYKNVHCLWTKGIMYISLAWKSLDSQLKLYLICVYTARGGRVLYRL